MNNDVHKLVQTVEGPMVKVPLTAQPDGTYIPRVDLSTPLSSTDLHQEVETVEGQMARTPLIRQRNGTYVPRVDPGLSGTVQFPGPTISYTINWNSDDGPWGSPSGDGTVNMIVDYGDGTVGVAAQSHAYLANGLKTIKLWMNDWTQVNTFYMNWGHASGAIPSFADLTSLTELVIDNNGWVGIIPDLSALTLLTKFYIQDSADVSGYTAGSFATQMNLADIELQDDNLDEDSINTLLHDLVTSLSIEGRVIATVNISGSNMANPTGQGLLDLATLQAAGWTINTNLS